MLSLETTTARLQHDSNPQPEYTQKSAPADSTVHRESTAAPLATFAAIFAAIEIAGKGVEK